MSLVGRLDLVQLEIVMHLANGKQIDEICAEMHRSRTDVNRRIKIARQRCQANTIAHLVSIAIATGDLVWQDERRTLNGHVRT
jgi:DNA-binding CsgD family transcriptional regulator